MSRWNSSQVLFAGLLILLGVFLLLGNLGLLALNWNLLWPVVVILFGIWLIWRSLLPPSPRGEFWGMGHYAPNLNGKSVDRQTYSHGFGDFDLDLSKAAIGEGLTTVHASHGIGELSVLVPRDLSVHIRASAGMGEVEIFGRESGGIGPTVRYQSDDYAGAARKLDLDASVGMGEVRVIRAG